MESEDKQKKGRPRKLGENDLHGYWRRKAHERKEKSEVESFLDDAFGVEIKQPKVRSCVGV